MYEQNNIVSPAGTIHANNPEEPRRQSLCIQYGSYHWIPTYEPITCKTCLRILGSRKVRDTETSIDRFNRYISIYEECKEKGTLPWDNSDTFCEVLDALEKAGITIKIGRK